MTDEQMTRIHEIYLAMYYANIHAESNISPRSKDQLRQLIETHVSTTEPQIVTGHTDEGSDDEVDVRRVREQMPRIR